MFYKVYREDYLSFVAGSMTGASWLKSLVDDSNCFSSTTEGKHSPWVVSTISCLKFWLPISIFSKLLSIMDSLVSKIVKTF